MKRAAPSNSAAIAATPALVIAIVFVMDFWCRAAMVQISHAIAA